MQFVFVSNIQNAYDCGYGTKFNAVCDRISFRQNVHKIIFKIDDKQIIQRLKVYVNYFHI